MSRRLLHAGALLIGLLLVAGCTTTIRGTASAGESPARNSFDDYPSLEVGDPPVVVENPTELTFGPGQLIYVQANAYGQSVLTSAEITGEVVAAVTASTSATVAAPESVPNVACGFDVVGSPDDGFLVTSSVIEHPASGADAAYYEIVFQGFDRSLTLQWTTEPLGPFGSLPTCERAWVGFLTADDLVVERYADFVAILDVKTKKMSRLYATDVRFAGDYILSLNADGSFGVIDPRTLDQVANLPPNGAAAMITPESSIDSLSDGVVIVNGQGLGKIDLVTGSGEWLIAPDNPAYGVITSVSTTLDDLLVVTVADSEAEDSPFRLEVLDSAGQSLWSLPGARFCGTKDSTMIVSNDDHAWFVDAQTGESTTDPPTGACDFGIDGYVGTSNEEQFTLRRVL